MCHVPCAIVLKKSYKNKVKSAVNLQWTPMGSANEKMHSMVFCNQMRCLDCASHWSPLQIHYTRRLYNNSFITLFISKQWHLIFYLITIESYLFQSISKFMRYLLGSLIVSLVRLTLSSNATRIGRQKLHTMIYIQY